jgi:hypothetical protein
MAEEKCGLEQLRECIPHMVHVVLAAATTCVPVCIGIPGFHLVMPYVDIASLTLWLLWCGWPAAATARRHA